jgi:hypothetical protein
MVVLFSKSVSHNQVPPSGIGQAVIFFEKTLKKVAISPNPLWQVL